MKSSERLILFLLTLLCSQLLFAESTYCDATRERPCLVQDTDYSNSTVRDLRSSLMIADYYSGNKAGLEQFRASASSQPSEPGWLVVADFIYQQTGNGTQKVTVIDLRQENHGYLNGNAITLTDTHDWINADKSKEMALMYEQEWLNTLAVETFISNILNVEQFKMGEYAAGQTLKVQAVNNEKDVVTKLGFNYHRLAVTDHRSPDRREVDAFIGLVDNLPPDGWLHIHCRGGKGRTTTFMVLYDMLKNADKVSLDEILARQAAIPPHYNLTDINKTDPELVPYYYDRLLFLEQFYHFAQSRLEGNHQTWSQWLELRKS
ncbi:tyrosine protein phosphatase [Legionella dresdenensis]|uniref:Tyrosine protein phosphatase n=1 Tax=Legionella dresdenensis TaxID=450200 RepID=A0ABV8CHU0_9GAMM